LKQIHGGGTLSSAAAGTGYTNLRSEDLPSSLLFEGLQDWIECQPKDRRDHANDIGGNRFAVSVPGQPAVWIFCKLPEVPSRASVASRDRGVFSAADKHNNSKEAYVYLSEIHYFLSLDTGNSLFCALPRHLYTDLAKKSKGIEMLRRIIHDKIDRLINGLSFLRNSSTTAPSSTIKRSSSGEFIIEGRSIGELIVRDDTHLQTRSFVPPIRHTTESCKADLWALVQILSYLTYIHQGNTHKSIVYTMSRVIFFHLKKVLSMQSLKTS
jgi:hypothetical protein